MSANAPTAHRRFSLTTLAMLASLAWRNIWRNPIRSALTVVVMVVSLTLMIMAFALMEGMGRQMTYYATNLNLGHLQLHRQEYVDSQDLYALLPMALVDHLQESTGYDYAPRWYAAGLASSGEYSFGALIKAIVPERETRVTDIDQHLRAGSFALGPEAERTNAEGIPLYPAVLGAQLVKNLRIGLGDELVLITQAADGSIGNGLFRVVGVMKPIDPAFDRTGVLLSQAGYQNLMYLQGGVHEVAVNAPQVDDLPAAQARIEQAVAAWQQDNALPEYGGPVVVRRWNQIQPMLAQMLEGSTAFIGVMGAIVFLLAALAMVNTMLMAIHERTHEFGILLALGFRRQGLMAMVMLESFFLALVAGVVGAITGSLWSWYLQVEGWDLSPYLPDGFDFGGIIFEPVYRAFLLPQHVVQSVVLMLIIIEVASLIPSWRTVRLRAAQVLGH